MILLPSSVSFYDSRFSTSIATNTTLNAMSIVEREFTKIQKKKKFFKSQEKKKNNATKIYGGFITHYTHIYINLYIPLRQMQIYKM